MKTRMKIFTAAVIFCIMLPVGICAKERIAVLPFTAGELVSASRAQYMTELFTMELVNTRHYAVLERMQLNRAIAELSLQNRDEFDETTAAEIGKIAGAEIVFIGNTYLFNNKMIVSIRGIQVATSQIMFAHKIEGYSDAMLEMECKNIAAKIAGITPTDNGTVSQDSFVNAITPQTVFEEEEPEYLQLYTDLEKKIYRKYLWSKWDILPTDTSEMKKHYWQQIAGGSALASVGGTLIVSSIIIMSTSVLVPSYLIALELTIGILTLIPGLVLTPLSAKPFLIADKLKSIYNKSTGRNLFSFLQRSSLGGGYDWENKEVTVAMAIKL